MNKLLLLLFLSPLFVQAQNTAAADTLLKTGLRAMSEGRVMQADTLMTIAVEMDDRGDLRLQLGMVKKALNDTCAACSEFQLAIAKGENTAKARHKEYCTYQDTIEVVNGTSLKKWADQHFITRNHCSEDIEHSFSKNIDGKDYHFELKKGVVNTEEIDEKTGASIKHNDLIYLDASTLPKDKKSGASFSNLTLMRHLFSNLQTPKDAKAEGVKGTVEVAFVIDIAGQVKNIEVVTSVDPRLDKEAVRVISLLEDFTPAELQGKPVNLRFTVPIAF
ncbi:MAG: energy transducer TonB [Flavobacteriales bacterium]